MDMQKRMRVFQHGRVHHDSCADRTDQDEAIVHCRSTALDPCASGLFLGDCTNAAPEYGKRTNQCHRDTNRHSASTIESSSDDLHPLTQGSSASLWHR